MDKTNMNNDIPGADGPFVVRNLHPGMGQAVAERTILRKVDDNKGGKRFENWGEVAHRVALGNSLLALPYESKTEHNHAFKEYDVLNKHIAKATLLMSGRHLQHGDVTQPERNQEVFTNCSTAAASFILFQLLLNGSGVGRSYDDSMMIVNWDYSPNLRVVLDTTHGDFDWNTDESLRDAKHKYQGDNVIWHTVEDSREGWAKAIEVYELLTYQKVYSTHTLVLDFSQVRPRGAPIMGMQGRPSSGPKPLMGALMKIATLKGAGMKPWRQSLHADHVLAECVLVGGARRAARMSTKHWRDKNIFEFIHVKRPIEFYGKTMEEVKEIRSKGSPFSFLWSSNNSIMVDKEFWDLVEEYRTSAKPKKDAKHAWNVLTALTEAAYGDGNGEPGLINVDKLNRNDAGWEAIAGGDFVGSKKYQVEDETKLWMARLAKIAHASKYVMICNPCAEICLTTLGGYCTIADVVPFHADTLDEAEEAIRAAVRSLIRVNTMDALYRAEVNRTNRIGVGLTGVHEFAWKFFGVGFHDLINPNWLEHAHYTGLPFKVDAYSPGARAAMFWLALQRFSNAAKDEAKTYSALLGVNEPHTVTTVKPSGSVSKLFGLTEGWHLPAKVAYLRWVQFRSDDPLVEDYKARGYPIRELKTYSGTTIVGFPTAPTISTLGMGDQLVTATEASPEDHYKWLMLGEKYWIGEERGNQISYTLAYDPKKVSYEEFRDMLITYQSQIRCCSVLPITDTSSFEYTPEEIITKAKYEELSRAIIKDDASSEDIDFSHIDCGAGACPIDFNTDK